MGVATDIVGMFKEDDKSKDDSSGAGSAARSKDSIKGIRKFHRGGKVRSTGLARLKKGEQVLTKGQQKRMKMRGKQRGGKSR